MSAVRLGQALHELGHEIFVFSSAPRGNPSRVYSLDWGVIVNRHISGRYMSLPYLFIYSFVSFFGLLHFCRHNKVNVINSHSGSVMLCAVPSVVGKILRVPVVHTQYCELFQNNDWFNKFSEILAIKLNLFVPNRFLGISRNVCTSLLYAGISAENVEMVPPVVPSCDKDVISPIQYRQTMGFNHDDVVMLFVGNLKRNKGIDVLFEAFIRLAEEFPTLNLIVTTELTHEKFWENKKSLQDKLLQHCLVDRVFWLGFVDDILVLIKQVDVVVVPFLNLRGISDYPLVILEAMSVGTPVVATDVGGTPEVLPKSAGFLVPPNDVDSLCKGLRNAVISKNQSRNSAKTFCLDAYHPNVVGRKYEELFLQEIKNVE